MADESNYPPLGQSLQEIAERLAARSEAREQRCVDLSELSDVASVNPPGAKVLEALVFVGSTVRFVTALRSQN